MTGFYCLRRKSNFEDLLKVVTEIRVNQEEQGDKRQAVLQNLHTTACQICQGLKRLTQKLVRK